MIKGALTSVILMFVFIPIPIVHFFAVPLSPFIGGFIGGAIAKAEKEKIIIFSFVSFKSHVADKFQQDLEYDNTLEKQQIRGSLFERYVVPKKKRMKLKHNLRIRRIDSLTTLWSP